MLIARIILRAARLAAVLHGLWPREVPPARAAGAAVAITLVADAHAPAELLAAIAYTESRFQVGLTNPRTKVCGPTQVKASSSTCARIVAGDDILGYQLAAAKLREARAHCQRRGTPTELCMLAVYCSGPRGPRERLYRQPRAILRRREALRRVYGARPGAGAERSGA